MTELLDRTITKLKTLPVDQQDAIAMIILEELEDEMQWNNSFEQSQDVLAKLAQEAMSEYHAGKTQELDLETL
jgi:methyltransferase-like protein